MSEGVADGGVLCAAGGGGSVAEPQETEGGGGGAHGADWGLGTAEGGWQAGDGGEADGWRAGDGGEPDGWQAGDSGEPGGWRTEDDEKPSGGHAGDSGEREKGVPAGAGWRCGGQGRREVREDEEMACGALRPGGGRPALCPPSDSGKQRHIPGRGTGGLHPGADCLRGELPLRLRQQQPQRRREVSAASLSEA